jgi:hypothetical protein
MGATEHCGVDTEVERLAEEHAALRRVATLVWLGRMATRSPREDTRHDPESKGPTMDVLLPGSRKPECRSERSDHTVTGAAATERAGINPGKGA